MRYFMIVTRQSSAACFSVQGHPKGLPVDTYRLTRGEPVARMWPDDVIVQLRPTQKGRDQQGDLVGNGEGFLIGSPAFCRLVEERCPGQKIELLPFSIHSHRRVPVADDYCFVNPIGVHHCVLRETDEGPVLDTGKLARKPLHLFRLPHESEFLHGTRYVISESFAADLQRNELTNVFLRQLPVE